MNRTLPGAVQRIVDFFEDLTPVRVPQLGEIYAEHAFFKDPFNEVRGLAQVQAIYVHMFEALQAPRFAITDCVLEGEQCFLVWEFHFRFRQTDRGRDQIVRGCSHLLLDAQGRIASHRDYWDAAGELYEKLPVLGGFMRWLKKKAGGR